jgi:hypothetical protein
LLLDALLDALLAVLLAVLPAVFLHWSRQSEALGESSKE